MYSCAEEKEFVKDENRKVIQFEQKTLDEVLQISTFNKAYQKLVKKNAKIGNSALAKSALEEEHDFTIVPDVVKIVTSEDGTVSYNMLIEREGLTTSYFENLVLQNDTLNNTDAFLIKYTPSETMNAIPYHDSFSFEGTTEAEQIVTSGKMFFLPGGCVLITNTLCYFLVPGDPEFSLPHPPSSQCTIPSNISTTTSLICPSIPFGGGVANPTTSGGTSTNNNNGLGSAGAGTTPINIATVPCRTNCIEDSFPKPTACDELKKEILRSKNAIDSLKLNLNLPGETGKALKKDMAGNYTRPNLPASENNKIVAYYGQDYIGSIHVHTVGYSTSFSFSDIYSLYKFYEYTPTVNNHEVKIILVCRDLAGVDQVYSLVITNPNLLLNAINAELTSNFTAAALENYPKEEDKLAYMLKKMDEKLFELERAQPDRELIFLKKFKDYGIKLYKANETLTNWSALTLQNPYSDNPTKLPVPCPN